MIIAIPTQDNKLAEHFGHCENFSFYVIENNSILKEYFLKPPKHEPGILPVWLKENNVNLVIAGGMGDGAQNLLKKDGIAVLLGVAAKKPNTVIAEYLSGALNSGTNLCDH